MNISTSVHKDVDGGCVTQEDTVAGLAENSMLLKVSQFLYMQHFHKFLQEFADDVVRTNGGRREANEPVNWPPRWGTLGEPSHESPFAVPEDATRECGQHIKHTAILSLQDSKKLEMFFHGTGPNFYKSCTDYMIGHQFAVFKVPLPDLPPDDSAGAGEHTAMDHRRITGPILEFLPVAGVQWLMALTTCAVCCKLVPRNSSV